MWKIIEARVGRVVGIAQKRGADEVVRRELEEFERRINGRGPVTAASLLNGLEVPTEFLILELQRPNLPPDQRRQMAAPFAAMVGSMGALLPDNQRASFRAGADALIRRVARAAGFSE